jgi:hypothetical protein
MQRLHALILACTFLAVASAVSFEPQIGERFVDFPTSTISSEAQRHFVRGMAWMHSFGYVDFSFLCIPLQLHKRHLFLLTILLGPLPAILIGATIL